jgi:uncharacterized membrane protein YgdD (TMEM256/DUF423 family)
LRKERVDPPSAAKYENDMKTSSWFTAGAVAAALGVAIGAFGAHGLPEFLAPLSGADLAKRLDQFETGVRYHMYQAFGMVILGLVPAGRSSKWLTIAGGLFAASILLFSGLLYLLVILNMPTLGMIVPLGGLAAIGAWAAMAFGARRE